MGALGNEVRSRAAEKYEAGREKVVDTAGDIDKRVHRNPWAYIGGSTGPRYCWEFFWAGHGGIRQS